MQNNLNNDEFIEIFEESEDYFEDCNDDETSLEISTSQNKECCYEMIYPTQITACEKPFSNVVGHDAQKEELLNIIDWFNRSKELKSKGISIPKGVILFGEPGNGKSLLIKEMIKSCKSTALIFRGGNTNVVEAIIETFKKAKETGHSIIVFDELDLLINKEKRVIRIIQECLDGVESSDDILVLAATNKLREIPQALTRNGRLEKLIKIPYPSGDECSELFLKYMNSFNVSLPEEFDLDEIGLALTGISCAGIKAIVNDIILRNGFDHIEMENIYTSIYGITDRIKDASKEENYNVSIHEAGHCVMAMAFPEYFKINRLSIKNVSGEFHAKEIDKDYWPYEKVIADIKISMAGIIAQKYILNCGSRGSEDDLQHARCSAYNLINLNGYSSCWETLPSVCPSTRTETQHKRHHNEILIERLLKKCERQTIRYVKKHSNEIIKLGNELFKSKHLNSTQIKTVLC